MPRNNVTHDLSKTRVYRIWNAMLTRCTNPNHQFYKNYGGRGITVCRRWYRFENFIEDMGFPEDNQSIDRLENSKGYSKDNCAWKTKIEQNNNTRRNVFIEFNGKNLTIAQWARFLNIKPRGLYMRLFSYNWPIELALTTRTLTPTEAKLLSLGRIDLKEDQYRIV